MSSPATYVQLGLALGLLFIPRGWLRAGPKVRKKSSRRSGPLDWSPARERDPNDRGLRVAEEVVKPRNWVDFARAALGIFGVATFLPELLGQRVYDLNWLTLSVTALLVTACLVQTLRIENRLSFFAPVFYLQGLSFGLLGPVPGMLSMVASWGLSPMLPSPVSMLACQAALSTVLGLLLLDAEYPRALIVGGVTCLPALLAVLTKRRLNAGLEKRPKHVSSRSERRA